MTADCFSRMPGTGCADMRIGRCDTPPRLRDCPAALLVERDGTAGAYGLEFPHDSVAAGDDAEPFDELFAFVPGDLDEGVGDGDVYAVESACFHPWRAYNGRPLPSRAVTEKSTSARQRTTAANSAIATTLIVVTVTSSASSPRRMRAPRPKAMPAAAATSNALSISAIVQPSSIAIAFISDWRQYVAPAHRGATAARGGAA